MVWDIIVKLVYNVCSDSDYFHGFHNDTIGILDSKSRMTRIRHLAIFRKFSSLLIFLFEV